MDEECKQSLKLWLSEGNYYVNHSPPDVSLYSLKPDEVKQSLSLDAFRFASHSAQTVFELERTTAYPKLTSWRVIQAYYAAYFAAHATLRFFGRSFSHLENGHVQFLKSRCFSEAGYSPNLPSSYYLIRYSPMTQNLTFEKCSESHKDLWKCYQALMRDISSEVLKARASEQRRQEVAQIFSELTEAITARGRHPAGNWLSIVRNEVNYKSLHGVWFPFSKSVPSFGTLIGKVKDWRNCSINLENPNTVKGEIERFFVTSFSIIDFGLSIALDYKDLLKKEGRRSADFSRLIKLSAAA